MKSTLQRSLHVRPSAGVVLGIIALVLACAGSATAGALITGKQIKDESITGADVKDGSLTEADLAEPAVASRSQRGPRGRRGRRGYTGYTGPPGLSGVEIVSAGSYSYASVQCPIGKKVIGGGARSPNAALMTSYPLTPSGWWAEVDTYTGSITAYAICANAL